MTGLSFKTYSVSAVLLVVGYFIAVNTSVVLNGTTSLPHNGYLMLRQPLILAHGNYVAFNTPEVVKSQFEGVAFVKRLVGKPGDVVSSTKDEVCVNGECRKLEPDLVKRGLASLPSGVVAEGEYVVFGDSADSLDSRYEIIGTVKKTDIQAAGFAIGIPHWKEIKKWMDG